MSKLSGKPVLKWIIASSAVFLLVALFISRGNVVRWIRAGVTISRQEAQIERYHEEIEEMEGRIRTLSMDIDSLETYARERFLFTEPGDDLYLVGK